MNLDSVDLKLLESLSCVRDISTWLRHLTMTWSSIALNVSLALTAVLWLVCILRKLFANGNIVLGFSFVRRGSHM